MRLLPEAMRRLSKAGRKPIRLRAFRDLRVTVKNVFISNDGAKAAIEWDWDVTRRRDGARAVTHDAIVVDLVGGRIASWREYFDLGNSIDAKP
jgi:ketosteroid isomerase-like protein